MKKIFLIIIIFFLIISFLNGSFENTTCSAKAEALGDAFCAYGGDLAAVNYNPAAIRLINNSQFMVSYKNLFSLNLVTYNSFVFLVPQEFLNVGLYYSRVGTTENADFKYSEETFKASLAGKTKIKNLYVGINISFLKVDSLADASCYGLDFGVLYFIKENFLIGAMIENLNKPILYWNTNNKETIDYNMRVGFRYSFLERFLIIGDFVNNSDKNTINVGVEFQIFRKILSLRCGINDAFLNNNYSFGFGVRYRKIDFDYAYKLHNTLQPTNVFSISLSF